MRMPRLRLLLFPISLVVLVISGYASYWGLVATAGFIAAVLLLYRLITHYEGRGAEWAFYFRWYLEAGQGRDEAEVKRAIARRREELRRKPS